MNIIYILLSTISLTIASYNPQPTLWPIEFIITFQSNITVTIDQPVVPVNGISYYDWTLKAQRIEHDPGAYECTNFYATNQSCTEYFLPDGLYRVLQAPTEGQEECCLDMPGIGALPPDWASSTNPTYNGVTTELYSGLDAKKWTFDNFPNTTNPHMYFEVDSGPYMGFPLLFTFPAVDGRQDFYYDPASMKVGPVDDSLFELPEGCEGKLCSTSLRRGNIVP
mmetsp:Transcript_9002/g.13536  ORF Transcript_9002/g.13536 Transcript_9002/m.13536 type:complete len:223 (+) Transcript_9002:55-723(+)